MRLFTLVALVTFSLSSLAADELVIGEKFELYSQVIDEQRPISVFIPKGTEPDEPLFVIYLLDSQHHFHTVTGIVQSLVDYDQIPKTMVVGIETTNRPRDYLPEIDGEPQTEFQRFVQGKWPNSGQKQFLQFLRTELFVHIEKNYNTLPHRTLIGHSNAGTLALSALFEQPDLFTNYLAISANGWWSYDQVEQNARQLTQGDRKASKLFITVAGEGSRFYTGTLELLSNMEKNKPRNLAWQFEQYPEHSHMSGILPAVSDGLVYLYSDFNFKLTPEIAQLTQVSGIVDYYSELAEKYGFPIQVPVDTYVELAQQQQGNNKPQAALQTLNQFVADYPEYSYAHMRLAQGLANAKQLKASHTSYVKALELAKQQQRDGHIIDALQDMVNAAQAKLQE